MGKRKHADPPVETKINVPLSLRTEIESLLYSEAEGRVPHGLLSRFFVEAVREKLDRARKANAEAAYAAGAAPAFGPGGYRDQD